VIFGVGCPSIFVSNTAVSPCFTSYAVGLATNTGDSITKYIPEYYISSK
jgi:hypothetical protein